MDNPNNLDLVAVDLEKHEERRNRQDANALCDIWPCNPHFGKTCQAENAFTDAVDLTICGKRAVQGDMEPDFNQVRFGAGPADDPTFSHPYQAGGERGYLAPSP